MLSTILILCLLIILHFRYSLFILPKKGLPILMYHKVSESTNNKLTVSKTMFIKQINFLKNKGYNTINFSDLKKYCDGNIQLPENPIIISFDDGYLNNYELAFPILKENNFKSTIFLPVYYINKTNEWDKENEPLINYSQIKEMSDNNIEFGLHTYKHINLENQTITEIDEDIKKCISELKKNNIKFVNVLAYPYGNLPENPDIIEVFKKNNIWFGLQIKSKINKLPIKNKYKLKRINVKGTDSFLEFKIKLKKGKSKLL